MAAATGSAPAGGGGGAGGSGLGSGWGGDVLGRLGQRLVGDLLAQLALEGLAGGGRELALGVGQRRQGAGEHAERAQAARGLHAERAADALECELGRLSPAAV